MKKRGHIKAPTSTSFFSKTFSASVVLFLTASRALAVQQGRIALYSLEAALIIFLNVTCNQLLLVILDLLMNVGKKSSTCLTKNAGFFSKINFFCRFLDHLLRRFLNKRYFCVHNVSSQNCTKKCSNILFCLY